MSLLSSTGNAGEAGHKRRIRTLDGLRAIAILLVIFDHYAGRLVAGSGGSNPVILEASGWAGSGVDLFFVLSGFLISGILMDSKGSSNYFRRFYWRRSLRIFPAFYGLLLFALVMMPFLFRQTGFAWFALYLRNWAGADRVSDGTLGHLWSLAVEEQFYIGWSIIVFLCPRRYLTQAILIGIATAPLVRAFMHYAGYPGYLIFRVTPARMDSLLAGALVAAAIRSGRALRGTRIGLTGAGMGLIGLVTLRAFTGTLNIDATAYQIVLPTLIALVFASVVLLCLNLPEGNPAHAMLTCAPFRVVAKYSYAIYLWHLVALVFAVAILRPIAARFHWLTGDVYAFAFAGLACTISFTMAAVSWRIIEQPALNLKDRYLESVEDREMTAA